MTPAEMRAAQVRLAPRVEHDDRLVRTDRIGGADVQYVGNDCFAAICVFENGVLVETSTWAGSTPYPYIPYYLSFREVPPLLHALDGLSRCPDVLICDGQGYAHPRRFGLACHLGVLLDLPTIGCAKSRLIGSFDDPGTAAGSYTDLVDDGEVIGSVLRTVDGVKPLFVSVGHRISLATARSLLVAQCRYRVPEPIRAADQEVRRQSKV